MSTGLSSEAEPQCARLLFGQLQRSPSWALRVCLSWRWGLRFWAGTHVQKFLLAGVPTRVLPGQLWGCEQTYSSSAPALASTAGQSCSAKFSPWSLGWGRRKAPGQERPTAKPSLDPGLALRPLMRVGQRAPGLGWLLPFLGVGSSWRRVLAAASCWCQGRFG